LDTAAPTRIICYALAKPEQPSVANVLFHVWFFSRPVRYVCTALSVFDRHYVPRDLENRSRTLLCGKLYPSRRMVARFVADAILAIDTGRKQPWLERGAQEQEIQPESLVLPKRVSAHPLGVHPLFRMQLARAVHPALRQ
jgi:hypothetical protein